MGKFCLNKFFYVVYLMVFLACNSQEKSELGKNITSFTLTNDLRLETILNKTQKYYTINIDTLCSYSLPFLLISQDGKKIKCKFCVKCKSYQGSLALIRHFCDTASTHYYISLQNYYKYENRKYTKSNIAPIRIGKHKELIHLQFEQEEIGEQVSSLFSDLNEEELERLTFVFVVNNKMYYEEKEEMTKQLNNNIEYLSK